MTLELECKPELRQYEKLNKLFVQTLNCSETEGSTVPDKLLEGLHGLMEEVAAIAYATGLQQFDGEKDDD